MQQQLVTDKEAGRGGKYAAVEISLQSGEQLGWCLKQEAGRQIAEAFYLHGAPVISNLMHTQHLNRG